MLILYQKKQIAIVKHQWVLSDTKQFSLVDCYLTKTKKNEFLVVGNGAGNGPYTRKKGKKNDKTVCVFTLKNSITYKSVAQFHLNGTEHLGIHGVYKRKKYLKYDRQVQVMFTCPFPNPKDIKIKIEEGDVLPVVQDISLTLISAEWTKGKFAVRNIRLKWAIPEKKEDKYNFVLCGSPVWQSNLNKITKEINIGTNFLVEWFEYWKALGVDHMHLYDFNSVGSKKKLIEYYQEIGFVTVHDWSLRSSHDLTRTYGAVDPKRQHMNPIHNWQHGQILTSQDCYWRTKNIATHVILLIWMKF